MAERFLECLEGLRLNTDLHEMLLARIAELMASDPPKDSPDGIRLDELVTLCEDYEKKAFPIKIL